MSLEDAERLTTSNVKFPANAYFAREKLYGWSVAVDVFHGHLTPIAQEVRTLVTNIVPYLHQLQYQMGDNPRQGLDYICRVLCECQQEYFRCVGLVAQQGTAGVPLPAFAAIEDKVKTFRASSPSVLPAPWHQMMGAPPHPHAAAAAAPSAASSSSSYPMMDNFLAASAASAAAAAAAAGGSTGNNNNLAQQNRV